MQKIATIGGATVGGWVGWWLGSQVGLITGYFLSVVGTGFGIYAGRRWLRRYFE
jgi:hypothetical protein